MADLVTLNIFDNDEFKIKNLRFSGKPSEEQRNELKKSGWRFTPRNGGVWYPHTNEAKNSVQDFVKEFAEKYYSEKSEEKKDLENQNIAVKETVPSDDEKIAYLENLIEELRAERKRDLEKIAKLESTVEILNDDLSEFYRNQEQAELDAQTEWEKENTLTAEEEKNIVDAALSQKTTDFVLSKINKAGIEVITDKVEFERILAREEVLQKMAGTLSDEEQKRYFTFNEDDTKKFIEQVDEWRNDNSNPHRLLIVGKIPPLFNALGIADNLIEVEQSTLDKMIREEPQGYPNEAQGHALSVEDIYAIPNQLANPVMVFKSKTRDDSYVFFTERKDSQDRTILIPLAVNKRMGRIVINKITSMYGRNNEIDFVKTNFDEGNLIYLDKERSIEWAEKNKSFGGERYTKVQFLGQRFTDIETSNINILTKERLVNFICADSRTNPVQKMQLSDNIYGFVHEGKIYLNPDIMNSNAAVHEYTHLWDAYTQKTNPELWQKGLDIFKGTNYWNEVISDPNYQDIKDDENLVLSEIHSRICGDIAEKVLNRIAELDGEQAKFDAIDWDREIDQYIYENFESSRTLSDGKVIKSTGYGAFGTVVDVNAVRSWFATPMKDLMAGKNISIQNSLKKIKTEEKSTFKETKNLKNLEIEVTPEELSAAKSVLPLAQYLTTLRFTQGEEGEFFKQKIKDIAKAVENAPKIGETDGLTEHPIVLKYFHPTGTEVLVSEIGKNGEAFGFQCINGDWEMAEWGYFDLNEIRNIPDMEVDYHIENEISVERYLQNEALEYFSERERNTEKNAQKNMEESKQSFEVESRQLNKNQELQEKSNDNLHEQKSKSDIKKIREQCKEILKKSDSEITEDEKEILAQYEGAGGLDEANRTNAGILNEFYTPQNLVEKVWQIVDVYAPNAKTVLEPSSGIGKFANNRPDNQFTMHELDETSARINHLLHPEAVIVQGAFQKQFFDDGERAKKTDYELPKYDVVIGNPPYGTYSDKYKGLGEGKEFDRYEEYFISRGLDSLKDENSVMAFVVPSGFLNSADDKQKELITQKGKLVDAYRLPVGMFSTTQVGTDIIVMQLSKNNEKSNEIISDGNWFKSHPEKILGEVKIRTNRFGKEEEYVEVHEGLAVQDELNKIDGLLPNRQMSVEEERNSVVAVGVAPTIQTLKNRVSYTALRASTTTVNNTISQSDSEVKKEKRNIAKSKGEVMSAYEFSRLYGKEFDEREFPIWSATDWQGNIDLSKLSSDDLHYLSESGNYVEQSIGKWTHKVLFTSGDIYAKIQEQKEFFEKSGGDQQYKKNIELLESVKKPPLDMERIHFGAKCSLAEEFKIEHIDADGNPVQLNLQETFILWATNSTFADSENTWRGNIDFATANISREELGEEITFSDVVNYIDGKPVKAESVRGWRTYDMSEEEKSAEKAERKKEADLKRQARRDTADRLFDRFLHEGLSLKDRERLEVEYNRRFNSYIAPDYSKLPLFIDGMSTYKGDSKFKLYDQQIKGISFLCNKGNGLLAYDVGVGKTAAGIVATVNQIQTGRCKRPLIVVPNQVYEKWYTDIRQLFPNIKVNDIFNFNQNSISNYIDKENPHRLNIPENSISLCTYEALKNITFTDESCRNALFEDFANLLSVDFDESERNNAKNAEKIENVIGAAGKVNDAAYCFFEECGFDNLTVDEAHNFKNLWVVPRPKDKGESNEYAGIPSGKPSSRALKMYAMTQIVQRNNDNRNVFMLTATPFTNSPTEVYSMLSYIGRERLKKSGINSLRDFLNEFAQTKQEFGVTAAGNIDTKQVMKNWKELPALQAILTEFIDKVDGEEAGIIRPNKFTHVKQLDMSDLQKQMGKIDEERMTEVREGNSAAVIVAMNNMRLSCVAPALANPAMYPGVELPPLSQLVETSPKLKFVCDAVIDMYKGNSEKGQFMYVPLGKESHGIIKDYLVAHGIPKNAVEIINGEINNTPEKKEKITSQFNDEKNPLKIIIGGRNTAEGIDLNGNSFVMYNCSLGWNPSETIQAEGRIWRQGNLQGNVHIVYPVMNDSIDSVLYQKHDEKRSRINELWNYKGDNLNVEDINPEDLKLDLIKDPRKKAKLILQEETKEVRAELSRINLKIKSFDEIIEKRNQLELDFSNARDMVDAQKKEIEIYKDRGFEVPAWIKTSLKSYKKDFSKAESGFEKVKEKLTSMKIENVEQEKKYINSLNVQKHSCEEKIKHIEKTLPQILQKLELEQMERKLIEYPIEKQREILEADILNNLRPMKEIEYEIKTMHHIAMHDEKIKAGDITQEEFDLYKNAGYEKYEKWQIGEIESLEENQTQQNEQKTEPKIPKDEKAIPSITKSQNETIDEVTQVKEKQKQQNDFTQDAGGLFFGFANDENLFVHSPESEYFNSGNDDFSLTPQQLTKAEQKRDEIVFPILNGKETGMYKAFNDFAKHGVFDVVGTKIDLDDEEKISTTGFEQLHSAMNIYRSKEFETFRYVLIDKNSGEINEQLAISSYMPNACKISLPDNSTLKQVISRAEETDSLVVVVHNHPSGNVTQSIEDVKSTKSLEKSFTRTDGLKRFAGHIILDHNTFNLYTPKDGWKMQTDWENVGKEDVFLNKDFPFSEYSVNFTWQLEDIAKKINDTNNWNDNYIPVLFSNQNRISGIKFYDKSFFDNEPQKIRNEFQFSGFEAGATQAFPVITKNFANSISDVDEFLFEEKLKNLVQNNAFTDVALPKSTVTEKYNIMPGKQYFNIYEKIEVEATWETKINPELFLEQEENKKDMKGSQSQIKPEKLNVAVEMEY